MLVATFKITPQTSRFTFTDGDPAFNSGTSLADSLTVDDGAYLIALGNNAVAADLDAQGAWSVTVNGAVFSDQGYALWLRPGNSKSSTIKVGATGEVGRIALDSSATLNNAGSIISGLAIEFNGGAAHTVINSGTIQGTGNSFGGGVHRAIEDNTLAGKSTIVNSGLIAGNVSLSDGNDVISNSGTLFGAVHSGGGNDTITNTGTVGDIYSFTGNDVVSNSGGADSLDLGDGNNKYSATASGVARRIAAEGGNDTVSNAGVLESIDLGNGTNAITILKTGRVASDYGTIATGSGNDTLTNAGTIDVAAQGAIALGDGINLFSNSGTATGNFIGGSGKDTFANSGTFTGDVTLGDSADIFRNTGALNGVVTLGFGDLFTNTGTLNGTLNGGALVDKITNSGTLTGTVALADGADAFTNKGTLNGLIDGGLQDDTITNLKTINGRIDLGNGDNTFINSGVVNGLPQGGSDLRGGNGDDTLVNSGTFNGVINLGDGLNTITNKGAGIIAWIDFGDGANFLTNSGTITGHAGGGVGNDTVFNTGRILEEVDLGDGDDEFTGGNFAETVVADLGSDTIKLGGGNDNYFADITFGPSDRSDDIDNIDGGSGTDTYWNHGYKSPIGANSAAFVINIDTVAHGGTAPGEQEPGFPTLVRAAANSASGSVGTDVVTGFENVMGGVEGDIIFGNAAANVLSGEKGSDALFGYGGNDTLVGGTEVDALVGGAGADKLTGGDGADQFIFQFGSDSGLGKAARDVILDFEDDVDKINLSVIDANSVNGAGSNEQFHFVGVNVQFFVNDPGALRVYWTPTGQTVEGDVNGDGRADFAIDITDPRHTIVLNSADFIL
jgi:hypothetical protein